VLPWANNGRGISFIVTERIAKWNRKSDVVSRMESKKGKKSREFNKKKVLKSESTQVDTN
jgi:hypothetical protein